MYARDGVWFYCLFCRVFHAVEIVLLLLNIISVWVFLQNSKFVSSQITFHHQRLKKKRIQKLKRDWTILRNVLYFSKVLTSLEILAVLFQVDGDMVIYEVELEERYTKTLTNKSPFR